MINGCPSISNAGNRCLKVDGHDGKHEYRNRANTWSEVWTDANAKKRIVLRVTSTVEYEVDLSRLGPLFNPKVPGDLAVLFEIEGEQSERTVTDWLIEKFEQHEGSTYGDEMLPDLGNYDRGYELIELSWYD